ncbi:M protein repeat protein [Ancylostoma duodenale]|uniref:M protein repeat protein n=1 Tax=Ancylostoma duodenale TaxID=51022 RepID=A0A0C2CJF7_9BILA|nr:M protein repeat protein [Ancylostoma duodenale]
MQLVDESPVEFLEKERENLQSQSESQAKLQNSQVNALEAVSFRFLVLYTLDMILVLESVTKEKEATKEHYEGLLVKERQQAEAREHAMKKEFSSKLNELEEQYTSLKEDLEHSARLDRDELREATQHEIQTLRTEKTLLEAEVTALKQKFLDGGESEDQITEQLNVIVKETADLTRTLEEYRQRINSKDEEIAALRRRVDQEQTLSEEQIRVIKDELRSEMLSSDEYQSNLMEIERLHSEIAKYERMREKEEEVEKERAEAMRKLEAENEEIKEKLHEIEEVEANKGEELESLKSSLIEKENELTSLKEDAAKLREENEKLHEESERLNNSDGTIREEMASLQSDNIEKTSQIEALHIRVKDLLDQMGGIKEELDKRNIELQQIGDRTDVKLEASNAEAEEKIKNLNMEYEKTINEMKQREEEMARQMQDLRKEISDNQSSKKESDDLVEKLKEEVHKKDEVLGHMEADFNEKKNLLIDKEQQLKEKQAEITSLEEKLKESMTQHDEQIQKLQEEMSAMAASQEEEEKPETFCMEIQTDPVKPPSPVQIVDLAREKELKSRIAELEHALERRCGPRLFPSQSAITKKMKNDLIEKLHEQIPDKSAEDITIKKKDRSQSMTTGGVFQNFVSQMKDKRDEANERSKKKEAERKAEKAAKEAARE